MSSERWFYIMRHKRRQEARRHGFSRRRERRWNQLLKASPLEVTAELIADPDYLFECFQLMRAEKGHGAGLDGVRVPEFTNHEVGRFVQTLSASIKDGTYRPQPPKPLRIPKDAPGQFRELMIPTVLDRVVALALNEALSTLWERSLTDSAWAYRPGRGVWPMLAKLLNTMEESGRSVLVIDDIATAFDRVPIKPLLEVHRRLFAELQPPDPATLRYKGNESPRQYSEREQDQARDRLLKLVRRVLTGAEPSRQRGIPQGGNYSPTALNGLLHEHLDQPILSLSKDTLWYRYSDNLTYLCQSVTEGDEILATIRSLHKPLGMTLKGGSNGDVLDLKAGDEAHLVGFTIRHDGQGPVLGLPGKTLNWLRKDLRECYDADNPPESAKTLLAGWVHAYGPALENGEATTGRILSLAADEGFREVTSPGILQKWIDESQSEWQRTRNTGRLAKIGATQPVRGKIGLWLRHRSTAESTSDPPPSG